ncbi:hypothetical protein [Nitrosopumilus maritimus]|uniref:Uncharacterized protein n=1 Tax=Nitrosopumilus maritimus (strain SCM1) TaxID=436308 RepID=A9A4N0_NITMS|nr:hypothetical protein [Nitrosopumilus maritimus]ABX13008.1 hypothetical protein Nmar_1112 [Nitrosopumilus maritimus SCM1]
MLEKQFDADVLYNRIVHFYMDKKGYTKEKANEIAQSVVQKEAQRRICKNEKCKHYSHDHIRNAETCLVAECDCHKFVK